MKTYSIRNNLRSRVQCQFCYFVDGTLAKGMVWDLSEKGWRSIGERPVPVGTEATVYITLRRNGKQSHNVLIDSAVVRWSEGREAGWEITRIDDASRARLVDFVEEFKAPDQTFDVKDDVHWY